MIDLCIVGAGTTGLFLADLLKNNFGLVLIIDKGRGVGGRLANRRFADSAFDTGAQFIRCRSDSFREKMKSLAIAGAAEEWFLDPEGNPVYKGRGKITEIAKHLVRDSEIQVENQFHLVKIEQNDGIWSLISKDGEKRRAKKIVFTSPLPQTLAILKNSEIPIVPDELRKLDSVKYRKTLVLIGIASMIPKSFSQEFQEVADFEFLDVVVDNKQKGVTDVGGSYTIHFDEEFSSKYYPCPDPEIHFRMLEVLEAIGFHFSNSEVKRWGFSAPQSTFSTFSNSRQEAIKLQGHEDLILAGDAFGGGSIEGTWRSANKVVQLLAESAN